MEADEAFRILHESYSEETKDQAYSLVLDQIGKFIEKNKLRGTNFPKRANSAMHILALGAAGKDLLSNPEKTEQYIVEQLMRIRDGGFDIIDQILVEIVGKSKGNDQMIFR